MTHFPRALRLCALLSLCACLTACVSSQPVTAVTRIADGTITRGVSQAISQSRELDASEISVATQDGTVQLIGYVGSADQVSIAATLARSVKGVTSVKNDLRLK